MGEYLTAPAPTKEMPKGIPYIIGNEIAERFSFYGMKTILFVFMTQYLMSSTGEPAFFTETEARQYQGWFVSAAYLTPLIGAFISDALWGKYKTILYLSLFYCVGHGTLALMDLPGSMLENFLEPRVLLMVGLVLIAFGSGGIKPCVSANVGDQFGESNKHLISRVYSWFYFSINFGSFFSSMLTPWLLDVHGPALAFGIPGILMGIATLVFWIGRKRFVHIPPTGAKQFVGNVLDRDGLSALLRLAPIFILVAVYWSCYDQSTSAWTGQATRMDRLLGIEWLESQIQAINPLLVLIFIPLFSLVIYPAVSRVISFTPLRRILAGFLLTTLAFAITAHAQRLIEAEATRFRDRVAPLVAADGIDPSATETVIRAAGLNALADNFSDSFSDRLSGGASQEPAGVPTARLEAMVGAGIAVARDGTRLTARWPSVGWQILAYLVITAAEILVSITCLEFSYTQAPTQMKSLVMSLYLLSVSLGNLFTALVNSLTQDAAGRSLLTGESYYWFFTGCMAAATLLFLPVLRWYRPREYIQGQSQDSTEGQPTADTSA